MSPQSFRSSLKQKLRRGRDSPSQEDEPENNTVIHGALSGLPIILGAAPTVSLPSLSRNRFFRSQSPHIRSASETQAGTTPDASQTNNASVPAIPIIAPLIDTNKANGSLPEHLWDEAYDELKESHPDLMQLYETILSRKLLDYNFDPSEDALGDNKIEQHAVDERRDQMHRLIQAGQERIERENNIKSGVKDFIGIIMPIKSLISSAVEAVPQAALPWAIVCACLEILQSPLDEPEANANGIRYVTKKKMEWYWGIATDTLDLANEDNPSDTRTTIKSQLVELYQGILLFQIKSVCSYYRNRGISFLRDIVKLDDWEGHLENIQRLETEFTLAYGVYTNQQQANYGLKMTGYLEKLVAAQLEKKEFYLEEQDQQCLRDLRITNPRHDRKRIIDAKGGLLWESTCWILENPQFQEWRDNKQSRLLWIKGDPGKGKTMLLCGLLKESEHSIPFTPCLSYFFCQGTDQRLNNANAVLRGLIYVFVIQQPSLLSHVRKEYKNAGSNGLFNDINAWVILSDIFKGILQDPILKDCYVVIDALDECASDRKKLLGLIVCNVSKLPHVK
ncbi:hypothetical protein ACHAQJ_005653 [Trichoderma viride]